MRTVASVAELRSELASLRRRGQSIGLVPTMGAFHEGHLSLMRHARADCDVVVVSLFINPTQFNEAADLDRYPRDEERDAGLAAAEDVDYLFMPSVAEVYPAGFATRVSVSTSTDRLEGASRGRAHFDGVATVVAKLFNLVGPDVAYFGLKDAQQVAVIRRMVRDLNLPLRIETCPTIREADGLAMSSRNALLTAPERQRATALHRALELIADALAAGERRPEAATAEAEAELQRSGISADYLQLVTPDTLEPVERVEGDVLAVIAARVGTTRLIDNLPIPATPTAVAAASTAKGVPR